MPLERCKQDNKNGWRYGSSGRCYTGPGAKKKAIKQGVAESYRSGEKFQGSEAKLEELASREITRAQELQDDAERNLMDMQDENRG